MLLTFDGHTTQTMQATCDVIVFYDAMVKLDLDSYWSVQFFKILETTNFVGNFMPGKVSIKPLAPSQLFWDPVKAARARAAAAKTATANAKPSDHIPEPVGDADNGNNPGAASDIMWEALMDDTNFHYEADFHAHSDEEADATPLQDLVDLAEVVADEALDDALDEALSQHWCFTLWIYNNKPF